MLLHKCSALNCSSSASHMSIHISAILSFLFSLNSAQKIDGCFFFSGFGHYLSLAALQQRRREFLDDLMFMCSGIFQLCFHIMGKGVFKSLLWSLKERRGFKRGGKKRYGCLEGIGSPRSISPVYSKPQGFVLAAFSCSFNAMESSSASACGNRGRNVLRLRNQTSDPFPLPPYHHFRLPRLLVRPYRYPYTSVLILYLFYCYSRRDVFSGPPGGLAE